MHPVHDERAKSSSCGELPAKAVGACNTPKAFHSKAQGKPTRRKPQRRHPGSRYINNQMNPEAVPLSPPRLVA
jgi:hypothetical protein